MKVLSDVPSPKAPVPPPVYTTADLKERVPEGVYALAGIVNGRTRAVVIGTGKSRAVIFSTYDNIVGLFAEYTWSPTDEQVVFKTIPGETK